MNWKRRSKYWQARMNTRHARRSMERRLQFKVSKRIKRRLFDGVPEISRKATKERKARFWDYRVVTVPSQFSLTNNPEESLKFLQEILNHYARREKVYIKMKDTVEISHDAIVVLLSIMVRFRSHRVDFNGDYPKDANARDILVKSGFFSSLFNKIRREEQYMLIGQDNAICTHANKNVDSALSHEIIKQSSATVWGNNRRCIGVQRVFMELMQNTNNHASIGLEGDKHWWLSVNHDKEAKIVKYSFIDFGVGIFKSLESKKEGTKFFGWATKLAGIFSFQSNVDVLKLILNGELHKTVTGKYYRGKGLPGIYNAYRDNSISNLCIITNDTYTKVSENKFITLKNNLKGTFVSWELNNDNNSLPWVG